MVEAPPLLIYGEAFVEKMSEAICTAFEVTSVEDFDRPKVPPEQDTPTEVIVEKLDLLDPRIEL